MEATTIPITSLSPAEAPPASKSIRAVVSLLWPYSSSTKQCALLLADPDFRLRNRKGQVRVRFTGASAEALAKGRIGIGDELVLELGGAQWAGEEPHVSTPGKSVDGELVYRGQLALSVTKKANGDQSDVRIQVNESTPPPEEPEQTITNGNHATPARAAPLWMRSSMGGADVTPIYSSPAFVKRSRLSGDKTSWDPFADVEKELEDDAGPRKRQRISFGGPRRWKFTDRTPSPEKEMPSTTQDDGQMAEATPAEALLLQGDLSRQISGVPTMPPPPLPRLQLPPEPQFVGAQQSQQATNVEKDGPSTPKLHPVPSSALPLPSPFPTEASQVQFGSQTMEPTGSTTALDALVEAADTVGEDEPTPEEVTAEEMSPVVSNNPVPPAASVNGPRLPNISPNVSLASTAEIVREEESLDRVSGIATEDAQESVSPTVQHRQTTRHSIPEYLSDTEEDEEMYYDHMRRRFPSVTESGRVRVDHQEEGYYDDLSEVHEDDVEEVIDPDAMGEEPESEESGDDASDEHEDDKESEGDASVEIQETPQTPAIHVEETKKEAPADVTARPAQPSEPSRSAAAFGALRDAREELRQETRETLKTPAGPPPGLFGFDGAADTTPFRPQATPQSERERVMKKTYSSLFGFKTSPSPERQRQPQIQTPTPAMPIGRLSQLAQESLEPVGASTKDTGKEGVEERPRHDEQSAATRISPSPAAREPVDPDKTTVEEAFEAIQKTGDSLPVADVQDGSLLSAVQADEARDGVTKLDDEGASAPVLEETPQLEETPLVNETPQVDIEMQDAAEEPVPDGIPINEGLGEAIAPESQEAPEQPPLSSAPKPTQVTVIDLGDDSEDDEQPKQPSQQPPAQAGEHEPTLEPQQQDSSLTGLAGYPLSQLPHSPPSQFAPRHTPQDSQGSALQSDMLDTTQTTVDRSEIVTPIADDFATVIPDTYEEETLWVNQGQQDGFFDGQMTNTEFEGAAMPQLTQQQTTTITDPYRYFSFQSATSVATDNSDNLPITAVQSFAEEQVEPEPAPVHMPEGVSQEEVYESTTMQLDPALSAPETSAVRQQTQIEETPQSDAMTEPDPALVFEPDPLSDAMTEPDPALVFEPDPLQSTVQTSSVMEVDSLQQQAQRQGSAPIRSSLERRLSEEIVAEQQPPQIDLEGADESQPALASGQASYPALPISPEESQHRFESQGFETQIPYHSIPNGLPPTPKLTQGDSLTENEVQIVVDEAEEAAPPEPDPPPRTRSQKEKSSQKTPVRRSPRKAQVEAETVTEDAQQESQIEPATSQRRRTSVQSDVSQPLLSPTTKTPVRRSPRKTRAATESLEEVPEREEQEAREAAASQTSPQQPSLTSVTKASVRKSPRKSQAESKTSEKASEDVEVTTPAKQATRKSARKEQATTHNGHMAVAEPIKESEEMEDTISITPPTKSNIRQSARKAQPKSDEDLDNEMADGQQVAAPAKTPTRSRNSFTSQLGRVPAAISNWFSPRRSSRFEEDEEQQEAAVEEPVTLKRERSSGFQTALSYFTPLSNLEEKLGPASQYQTDNTVDVLAVVTDETKAPERAKGGPRDYYTIFRITDTSFGVTDSVRAEVFRPWHSTLPKAQVGDVVLLRAFAVKTRKRTPYLISTDASGWCVWRYSEEEGEEKPPATRTRGASFSATSGAREVIKGPPVELGEEERERAAELRKWWMENKKEGDAEEAVQVSPRTARTTRSQKL